MRKIEVDNLSKRLEQGDIVLLTSLGYSSSGEVFSVPSESLAAECAYRLGASKIIFQTQGQVLVDGNGYVVQSLRLGQATALLERYNIQPNTYNSLEADADGGLKALTVQDADLDEDDLDYMRERGILSDPPIDMNSHSMPARSSAKVEKSEGEFIRLIARLDHASLFCNVYSRLSGMLMHVFVG